MDIFNSEVPEMMEKALARQLSELPPEAKAALEKTQVSVVKKPDRIEIVINSGGDPIVEKVRDMFLNCLIYPLARLITVFGCKANVVVAVDK